MPRPRALAELGGDLQSNQKRDEKKDGDVEDEDVVATLTDLTLEDRGGPPLSTARHESVRLGSVEKPAWKRLLFGCGSVKGEEHVATKTCYARQSSALYCAKDAPDLPELWCLGFLGDGAFCRGEGSLRLPQPALVRPAPDDASIHRRGIPLAHTLQCTSWKTGARGDDSPSK